MKNIFHTLVFLICLANLSAQMTGSFSDPILFNSDIHEVAYYVPVAYDSAESYPLIVALHGCGGNAIAYRDDFISIADSIGAILVCPDFMGDQMSGSNGQIIPNVIDSTINQLGYNINTAQVYLTGFSCNGQETMKQGWSEIYPFKGLIPLNAWVPSISNDYNYDSRIPTCICSGTNDGSYNNNTILYENLISNNGLALLNSMPGIGHVSKFPTRDAEMMECFDWINSIVTSIDPLSDDDSNFIVYPNPSDGRIYIKLSTQVTSDQSLQIYNSQGAELQSHQLNGNGDEVVVESLPSGHYILQLKQDGKAIYTQKLLVIE